MPAATTASHQDKADSLVKGPKAGFSVIPAEAGSQLIQVVLDPAFAGSEGFSIFYEIIKNQFLIFPLCLCKILPVAQILSLDLIPLWGRGQSEGHKRGNNIQCAGVERNKDCRNRLEGP